MRMRVLGFALLLSVIAAGCVSSRPSAVMQQRREADIGLRLQVIAERLDLIEQRLKRVEDIVDNEQADANDGQYVVKSGDYASGIARAFGMTMSQLAAMNPGVDMLRLRPGQVIKVR